MAGAFATRAPKITNISICGSQTSLLLEAGATIGGHRMVYIDSAGGVQYASNDVLADSIRSLGLSLNAAVLGDPIAVQTFGEVVEASWSWTLDTPIYLGSNGQLTQTPPTSPALFQRIIGFPLTTTSLFLSQREPIVLAP